MLRTEERREIQSPALATQVMLPSLAAMLTSGPPAPRARVGQRRKKRKEETKAASWGSPGASGWEGGGLEKAEVWPRAQARLDHPSPEAPI